ncbi:Zinc finger protein CONSTANS-LIKE 13 [Hordeum vulgare]|nr:Zinc finger protein CONSTANS-LIKE 13 [Hordeum vulgare]
MAPVHLVPPEPRVVSLTMAQQGREVRERLEADAAAEAYMQELHRQYPKLVEAERMIFADADDEVIIISSSDEVEGDKDDSEVGGEDEKINIDEWRSVFPDDKDDGTGPDPSRGTPYVTRKD